MELLSWHQEGFASRKYNVHSTDGPVGQLVFRAWTSNDAEFTAERITLHFQRQGWLEHEVTIRFKGEVVGMSKTSGFGKTTTTLVTGERFMLEGKALDNSSVLVDAAGNTMVRFEPEGLGGNRGSISIEREIPELTKHLLVAIGLYFKNLGQ